MLVEVLETGEGLAGGALAVFVGAVEQIPRSPVLVVDLALVAKHAPDVRKAWELLATLVTTLVRSGMLVHMFAATHKLATKI